MVTVASYEPYPFALSVTSSGTLVNPFAAFGKSVTNPQKYFGFIFKDLHEKRLFFAHPLPANRKRKKRNSMTIAEETRAYLRRRSAHRGGLCHTFLKPKTQQKKEKSQIGFVRQKSKFTHRGTRLKDRQSMNYKNRFGPYEMLDDYVKKENDPHWRLI